MSKIFLKNNKGFSWYSSDSIFIKGCFFDKENNYYEKENTISYFRNITNPNQFMERIKALNGIFTVLIKYEHELFIASDTTRIFPLFYTYKKNQLFISDDIVFLKEKLNISTFSKPASKEFLAAGHTLGKRTLLKNIFQLQSSEYLYFKNNILNKQGFFFSYSTNTINNSSYTELKKQATKVFENSFERLITSLKNRQVIIPLSGGYDSRLIAVMLKKHNYENVLCYTYGKKNNHEIENSRKTAEALNFKWIFIEYTVKIIDNYINTQIFKDFVHYTCKYSSMPSLQEFFAVKYLSENKLIEPNSIFIPGHVGDFLGGSNILKIIPEKLNPHNISKLIFSKKLSHNKISQKAKNVIKIRYLLTNYDKNYNNKLAYSVFEDFDFKERVAKVLFKASGVYTFFGYEHRFPFWDKELITFFKNTPIEFKKMKLLYDDVLKNNYFEVYNVNYKKENQPTKYDIVFQKIKEMIKPYAPNFIKKHFLLKNDWLNSSCITSEMEESLRMNKIKYHKKIKVFNELNIQWYYYYSLGKIKK